jgi:multidrug transporter EmrE-like cation transporter
MSDERPDGRSAFEAGLANEYFALSGLRSSSIAEAGTRATLFFTTLTGTVLALGFLAGTTNAVVPVAYAALPIVILLGLLSFLRLVDISVEDVGALGAINRIRAYYAGLVPEGTEYFPAPGQTQAINELVDIGERRATWRAALTIAATVGVMDALVTGASLAFALSHLGAPTALAVVAGIAVALAIIWGMFLYQSRRFGAALRVVKSTP